MGKAVVRLDTVLDNGFPIHKEATNWERVRAQVASQSDKLLKASLKQIASNERTKELFLRFVCLLHILSGAFLFMC